MFYNYYKGFFSVILFAVVNANKKILYVQPAANGSVLDSDVLNSITLKMIIVEIYHHHLLYQGLTLLSHIFLGEGAFALNKNVMQSFQFEIQLMRYEYSTTVVSGKNSNGERIRNYSVTI